MKITMKLNFNKNLSQFDKKRGVILPKRMSEELAELIGILSGDGSVNVYRRRNKIDYRIDVAGNSFDDRDYLKNHVNGIFKKLFNVEPFLQKIPRQKTIRLVLRSKGIFYFLKYVGLNIGPKINIRIPDLILCNKKFTMAFIRGLTDTDGGIYFRNGRYPIISIQQKSKSIIIQLEKILTDCGFYVSTVYDTVRNDKRGFTSTGNRIYINGNKNLSNWMKFIGFNNSKNLEKLNMVGQA